MYDVDSYPNINRLWTGLLIDLLTKREHKHFFTSPGLRNAPILSSIVKNQNAISYSGIDERAMAYRALGHAKATGKASVLVCTSGTALANYLPAVIEAYKTNIPLIIISADRPRRLVERGDNQSIEQTNIFGPFVRGELNLEAPTLDTSPQEFVDTLCRFLSDQTIKAPVHINMPFDEPLDLSLDKTTDKYREACAKVTLPTQIKKDGHEYELPKLETSRKTLIVVGPIPEYQDTAIIKKLIKSSKLPCLLDIGSGLKFSDIDNSMVLPSFEHPEIQQLLEENAPEQIIHVGGRLASKHYYSFLKNNAAVKLLLIGNEGHFTHPADSPTWEIKASIESFCEKALKENYLEKQSAYLFDGRHIIGKKEDIIENSNFSFPSISKSLVEIIPNHSALYLGNSTTIRSFDAFASTRDHKKEIKVLTHRGASGIEGLNAAALGFSEISKGLVTLVLGDISFMHDLNSLLMLKDLKIPLVIIVVNNKGGGIFRHLPIAKDTETLPLITTEHELNFKGLCSWLNINYKNVENISDFKSAYENFVKSESVCVIEASIDQEVNISVYNRLKTLKL